MLLLAVATTSICCGQVRTVAMVGDAAPGAPAGAKFLGFSIPSINDAGEVLVFAALEQGPGGVTSANDRGFWSELTGTLDVVALEGDHAPGTPPGVLFGQGFDAFGSVANEVAVVGHTLPPGVAGVTNENDYGLWKGDGDLLSLAFREGDHPPNTPAGAQYSGFFPLLNNAGQVTVLGSLLAGPGGVTSASDRGIWTDRSGTVTYVTREGDPPPGMPSAVVERLTAPVMNDLAHIAYAADLLEGVGGVTVDDDETIWSDRGGSFQILYREGEVAPGVPGSKFEALFAPQINKLGRVAFVGEMKVGEGGVTEDTKKGLWAEDGNGLQLLARAGDPAPGLPGVVYTDVLSSWIALQSNDAGAVAFVANLDAPGTDQDGASVWSTASGSLSHVMRRGDPAPGTAEGVTFNSVQTILTLRLNKEGQTAFCATLQGPGITGANDFGIWAQDTDGVLRPIAIEGQLFEVAPGDFRHISLIQYGDFNDRGEVTFNAAFTEGGQGVFVSQLVATLGLPGDYNENDVVDAADYTTWRDAMTAGLMALPNRDPSKSGPVDEDDFLYWRGRFGNALGAGAGIRASAVPEPTSLGLIALGGCLIATRRQRRAGDSSRLD